MFSGDGAGNANLLPTSEEQTVDPHWFAVINMWMADWWLRISESARNAWRISPIQLSLVASWNFKFRTDVLCRYCIISHYRASSVILNVLFHILVNVEQSNQLKKKKHIQWLRLAIKSRDFSFSQLRLLSDMFDKCLPFAFKFQRKV